MTLPNNLVMFPEQESNGELLANLLHFGRLLRQLGMTISAHQISDLAESLLHIDCTNRQQFYSVVRAYLVKSHDEIERFDHAFDLFWSGRQTWLLEFGMAHQVRKEPNPPLATDHPQTLTKSTNWRHFPDDEDSNMDVSDIRVDATYSAIEILRTKDFGAFTEEELYLAKAFIRNLNWHVENRLTRRLKHTPKHRHHIDLSRTLRHSMRYGGEIIYLKRQHHKLKPRPLVVICDISGSMDRYSRLFLHFIHSLNVAFQDIEAFVFGTRLTRITPSLKYRDIDEAINRVAAWVVDWSGGTRIGESLRTFNYDWSRRVLGRGAVVVIISDGWDRGDIDLLEREISRLRRSVSRLIWLNPLAGSPTYQPLVKGMQAVLPHCDEVLPLHNLRSMEELAVALCERSAWR
jgi:uncharacterized protein with von Willebrand factor type A (vWA) domain